MLSGKKVLVIGAGGLLGKSFVEAIIKEGGNVIAADKNVAALDYFIAKHCDGVNSENRVIELDITDNDSFDRLEKSFMDISGLDSAVICAYPKSRSYGRSLEDVTYDGFCENIDLHLGGYFLSLQRLALLFKNSGSGNIVVLSSIYGSKAPRFDIYEGTKMTMPVEYSAIKAGVENLVRYFAAFYANRGIRFNLLSPGGVRDGQSQSFQEKYNAYAKSKGMLDPDDLCGPLIFLLGEQSKYLNGHNLIVDDGWSL